MNIELSEKNQRILEAARNFEGVLTEHGMTLPKFGVMFYGMGFNYPVEHLMADIQAKENEKAALQSALGKLTKEEEEAMWKHYANSNKDR